MRSSWMRSSSGSKDKAISAIMRMKMHLSQSTNTHKSDNRRRTLWKISWLLAMIKWYRALWKSSLCSSNWWFSSPSALCGWSVMANKVTTSCGCFKDLASLHLEFKENKRRRKSWGFSFFARNEEGMRTVQKESSVSLQSERRILIRGFWSPALDWRDLPLWSHHYGGAYAAVHSGGAGHCRNTDHSESGPSLSHLPEAMGFDLA